MTAGTLAGALAVSGLAADRACAAVSEDALA
jgi:hypothetical protein